MTVRLRELYVDIDHSADDVRRLAVSTLGVAEGDLAAFTIVRRSIDARHKPRIKFVYIVELALTDPAREVAAAAAAPGDTARLVERAPHDKPVSGSTRLAGPVLVVGAGPAGLFAALRLARAGYAPVVVERGRAVEARREDVRRFAKTGELDKSSNVVFGEGGASTYSDGKLTHQTDSDDAQAVMRTLVECGADADVLVNAKPHVGSDVLPAVIGALRGAIERAGGAFRFSTRASAFELAVGGVTAVSLEGAPGDERVVPGAVVIACGSSARDTWRALVAAGVTLEGRPTLIGIRVEHPQAVIDRSQYGAIATHPALGAAEYFIACPGADGRKPVRSFCMCPGGWVIPVGAQPGMLSTNGMSRHSRDSGFANAGLITPVDVAEYGSASALAGVEFIERLEAATFELGGGDYALPCQRLADFVEGRSSNTLPPGPGGIRRRLAKLNGVLPGAVEDSIRSAARAFDRKIRGFVGPSATAYGFELRTGSPLRIGRGDSGASTSAANLFPAGEGAGYAGGIVSSAVDGWRQAAQIIRTFARPG